jgi:rhodanese-related sulfurtransferase
MKRKNLVLTIIFLVCIGVALNASYVLADMTAKDLVEQAKKNVEMISLADAKAVFEKGEATFLDCRTEDEYKSGHIPGAINIPRGLLEFKIDKKIPDKNASIIMYCKSGGRACLACESIGKLGYSNVKNMEGGWKAWLNAGYPVE